MAPVFFAGDALDVENVVHSLVATVAFTLASAAVYVFNDIQDLDADRAHPLKCRRPIAAGQVAVAQAWTLFLFLLVAAAIFTLIAGLGSNFALITGLYVVLNMVYSLGLKKLAIVELFVVAAGYVLRVLAGGAAIAIEPSPWILCVTALLALFLIAGKRRVDLVHLNSGASLDGSAIPVVYDGRYLEILLGISAAATLLSYILFTVSSYAIERTGSRFLIATSVFVAIGIFRYLHIVVVDQPQRSPTEEMLRDPLILAASVCWVVAYSAMFYL